MIRRVPVKKRRSRPRPGRLKGDELGQLRERCFDRDGGRCVDCSRPLRLEQGYADSMDMAHVRGKRNFGDNMSNVRTKCFLCHRIIEHQYGPTGLKPVPKKERRIMKLTGGLEIAGGSPDVVSTLKGRSDFIAAYCKEKGWDADNLDMAQVMEIRAQDGWKKPL